MALTIIIAILSLALLTLLGFLVGKFSKGVRQGYAEGTEHRQENPGGRAWGPH